MAWDDRTISNKFVKLLDGSYFRLSNNLICDYNNGTIEAMPCEYRTEALDWGGSPDRIKLSETIGEEQLLIAVEGGTKMYAKITGVDSTDDHLVISFRWRFYIHHSDNTWEWYPANGYNVGDILSDEEGYISFACIQNHEDPTQVRCVLAGLRIHENPEFPYSYGRILNEVNQGYWHVEDPIVWHVEMTMCENVYNWLFKDHTYDNLDGAFISDKYFKLIDGTYCKFASNDIVSANYNTMRFGYNWYVYNSRGAISFFRQPTRFQLPRNVGEETKLFTMEDGSEFWVKVTSLSEYNNSVRYKWRIHYMLDGGGSGWYPINDYNQYTCGSDYEGYISFTCIASPNDPTYVRALPCGVYKRDVFPSTEDPDLRYYFATDFWNVTPGGAGGDERTMASQAWSWLFRGNTYANPDPDPPGPTPPEPPTPTDPDTFTFYNHSKKVNSTKQPSSGTEIKGYFRDAYNLLNPTIMIEANNEFPYNYVKWHDSANNLDRYYWIQNKAWMRNKLIEITLEEDMLATFKTSIGNMNAFVVRSASNFNPLITDTAWTTKNGIDLSNSTPVNQPFDVANGFYVVGIMEQSQGLANHNFARKGGVDYFACKDDELNELIEFLADKGATGEWADYRPIDRVVYLRFYPFNPGTPTSGTFQNALFQHEYNDGGTMREVEFTWELHGYGGIVGTLVSGSGYVDFGNHPDAGSDKTYLNYMPYTEMELKAGPFGRIDLSKNLIDKDNAANRLDFTVTADLISGLAKLHIYSGQNLIYYTEDHSCTVDIAISAEFVNRYSDIQQRDFNKKQAVLQTASQAASAGGALVGAATFQNPLLLASGVALMANAIATQERGKDQYIIDSYNMSIPQLSCRGTNGTWMKISENWRLITTYHRIAGDGGAILGRPKNDTVQISSCSGYLICNAASFEDSNAILTEIISINEYLNKGFYFE